MIGVVVPTFNESADRLIASLTSIVQTMALLPQPFQVVVVDDGSAVPVEIPDDVDERVGILRLTANVGPAAALNAGCAELIAQGATVIARLDVGDVWFPESKALQLADALDTGCAASFSPSFDEATGRARPVSARWATQLYRDNQFQASTTIVRVDVAEAIKFDESLRYCDDWDFAMRVQHAYGWRHFDAVTGTATAFPDGHTATAEPAARKECRRRVYLRGLAMRQQRSRPQ